MVKQDERCGGDGADPPGAEAYPSQGFEGDLEQRGPALGQRAGGGMQGVDVSQSAVSRIWRAFGAATTPAGQLEAQQGSPVHRQGR